MAKKVDKPAPAKAFFTQIQSGKFKGKKLFLPNFATTRSTKSRVKACVFSVLRPNLAGKIFVEVFGGSGAMALEALSNGAEQAFIIEKDDKAYQIACKNAQNLGDESVKVFQGDSFTLLPNLCQNSNHNEIIAYFDPPFHLRAGFADIYERIFSLIISLPSENLALFIIEHSSKAPMPAQIGIFRQNKCKKFGNTALSFYAKANSAF